MDEVSEARWLKDWRAALDGDDMPALIRKANDMNCSGLLPYDELPVLLSDQAFLEGRLNTIEWRHARLGEVLAAMRREVGLEAA